MIAVALLLNLVHGNRWRLENQEFMKPYYEIHWQTLVPKDLSSKSSEALSKRSLIMVYA